MQFNLNGTFQAEAFSAHALLFSWDAWLLTAVLAIVVPTVGYLRARSLVRRSAATFPGRAKLAFYFKIIGWQWFLTAVMLLIARRHGLSVSDVGERVADARVTWIVTASLVAIVAAVFPIARWRLRRRRTPIEMTDALRRLMPASRLELTAFLFVGLTAGICEELLYRGWLVNIVRATTG